VGEDGRDISDLMGAVDLASVCGGSVVSLVEVEVEAKDC
jgi:hypothetical protein